MPLFESQRKRNARLFQDAWELMADWILRTGWQPWTKDTYVAWLRGGGAAASHAVGSCEVLSTAWGKGGKRAALNLTQVFAMPMISRFSRWNATMRGIESEPRQEFVEKALASIFRIPAEYPLAAEETVAEYLRIAKQFEFDEASKQDRLPHFLEMDYLLSRSLLVLGHPNDFSLGSVSLPVADLAEFLEQGGKPTGLELTDYASIFEAVHNGAEVMSSMLKTGEERRKREAGSRKQDEGDGPETSEPGG